MDCVTLPAHGTLSRYHRHGCRCPHCREAARLYAARVARLTAYGQWRPFADADPVREHLAVLAEFGIGALRAARLAGVSPGAVQRLLWPQKGRPVSQRIRTQTAQKLLAVRPTLANCAPLAVIHAAGTRRRLQALTARGFPAAHLAPRLGLAPSHLCMIMRPGYSGRVQVATARAVAALYDQLWDADPRECGVPKHGATYARTIAKKHGWPLPCAWDDDTIDDPAARPDLGERTRRQDALIEDAAFITATTGITDLTVVAARLGVSRTYLDKVRERHRAALAQAA